MLFVSSSLPGRGVIYLPSLNHALVFNFPDCVFEIFSIKLRVLKFVPETLSLLNTGASASQSPKFSNSGLSFVLGLV